MSIKFSIAAVSIATMLAVAHTSIASADTYKTSKNQVVVTGLNAKQKYDIEVINATGKSRKRQLTTNTCGDLLIDNAVKYKSLSVGGQTIDPSTLKTQTHQRCKPKKTKTAKLSKQKTPKLTPANIPTDGTTTAPASGK